MHGAAGALPQGTASDAPRTLRPCTVHDARTRQVASWSCRLQQANKSSGVRAPACQHQARTAKSILAQARTGPCREAMPRPRCSAPGTAETWNCFQHPSPGRAAPLGPHWCIGPKLGWISARSSPAWATKFEGRKANTMLKVRAWPGAAPTRPPVLARSISDGSRPPGDG